MTKVRTIRCACQKMPEVLPCIVVHQPEITLFWFNTFKFNLLLYNKS